MVASTLLFKILDLLLFFAGGIKRVVVRVHRANLSPGNIDCYFINVTNNSPTRDVEITHVWLATVREVHLVNNARPLPKRLKSDETWETWIPFELVSLAEREQVYILARVRLSTGKVFASKRRDFVPPVGRVPG